MLLPNDTMMVSSPPTFTNFTGIHTFCLKTTPGINAADPLADTVASNNDRCATIHIIPLSVSYLPGEKTVNVFPIPATEVVNWEELSGKEKLLSLTDVNGKVVFKEVTSKAKGQIDISNLPRGTYFLGIRNSENRLIRKTITVN
jgi:hypothetical protein